MFESYYQYSTIAQFWPKNLLCLFLSCIIYLWGHFVRCIKHIIEREYIAFPWMRIRESEREFLSCELLLLLRSTWLIRERKAFRAACERENLWETPCAWVEKPSVSFSVDLWVTVKVESLANIRARVHSKSSRVIRTKKEIRWIDELSVLLTFLST